MAVVFVPNVPAWEFEFESERGMVGRHMAGVARLTTEIARMRAPKRTWALATSIEPDHQHGTTWQVTANAAYSLFVHEGTYPHVITAQVPGRRLKFRGRGGGFVYPLIVHHPGNRAQPFLVEALQQAIR